MIFIIYLPCKLIYIRIVFSGVAVCWWASQLWPASDRKRNSLQHDHGIREIRPSGVSLIYKITLYVLVLNGFASTWFQVAIHAIGDRANDLILDIYESVVSTNGMRDRRFRVNLRKWSTILKICCCIFWNKGDHHSFW